MDLCSTCIGLVGAEYLMVFLEQIALLRLQFIS